jgi:hypothetical protein
MNMQSNSVRDLSTFRLQSRTFVARIRKQPRYAHRLVPLVSNIPHAFAIQSMAAEIAHALGRDPKNMLLELIGPDRIVEIGK